ncbi:MAG: glycosyltransferase family 2 protein [bacterium]|nr:glycosyltransferase family 2 protein [bacterium]
MQNSFPKVAIVVVNWNRRTLTLECLDSLKSLTYPNYRIMVVDNGSSDGSVEAIERNYLDVSLLRSTENLRYAGGNNLALKVILESDDDFVLLLNNDTTVDPKCLDYLIAAASDPRVGLVGPKILYHDRPDVIWFAGGIVKPAWGYVRHYGLRQSDDGSFDKSLSVSFLTGCCLLIKREVLQRVGLLDENFYLYSEDADYCLRTAEEGFQLIYEPRSRIFHKVSASTGGGYNLQKWKHRYFSLFRLVRKHAPFYALPLFGLNLLWELVSLPINAFLQTKNLPAPQKSQKQSSN